MPSKAAPPLLPEDLYLRAAALGRTAAGRSGPNPPVGCVLVRDGAVVGEGATDVAGGPHAEVVALAAAGAQARGAVAIVTLEPCAHSGRTGPCTEALIAAGVREVHIMLRDPDPRAAGGLRRLREAGVDVVEVADSLPEVAAQVVHDLRGFVTRVHAGRPHVTLKLAQDLDGRTAPGPSGYLTGVAARTRVHRLRADVDAVLVGSATVRSDDPQLDVRHGPSRRSPRPVVLATGADVDPAARVVARGAIVLVGQAATPAACARLAAAGADIVRVPSAQDGAGGIDLRAGLAALLDRRILTVLAEPGPRLAQALLVAGLVDAVELHVAGASRAIERTAPSVTDPSDASPRPREVIAAIGPLRSIIGAWRQGSRTVTVEELDGDLVLRADWAVLNRTSTDTSTDPSIDGGVGRARLRSEEAA